MPLRSSAPCRPGKHPHPIAKSAKKTLRSSPTHSWRSGPNPLWVAMGSAGAATSLEAAPDATTQRGSQRIPRRIPRALTWAVTGAGMAAC